MDEQRLKSVSLFATLSRSGRHLVARLADDIEVAEGKELTEEGRYAHEFFVIQEGTADVRRDGETIATLGPGDYFGEIGLVRRIQRTATVVATSPMRLVVLDKASFASMRHELPWVAAHITASVDERMQANPLAGSSLALVSA
jgi:CRP-like cAMP-binding protein